LFLNFPFKYHIACIFLGLFISACSTNKITNKNDVLPQLIASAQNPQDSTVLIAHLKKLSSDQFAGRKIDSKGSKLAQQYIKQSLVNSGVLPFSGNYYHAFRKQKNFNRVDGTNIIGVVKGSKYPNSFIVLSAHYDHLGVKGGAIFNGTDDNASGVAALLAFAEKIQQHPLKHTVIFLFTDGEESGLYGSKAFVAQNKKLLKSIKLNINLDMLSGYSNTRTLHYIEKGLTTLIGTQNYQNFKNNADAAIKIKSRFRQAGSAGLFASNKINYVAASDQSSFHRAKIPFIYYGVGVHPNYHTKNDDFAHANIAFYINACHFIYNKIIFIDQFFQ